MQERGSRNGRHNENMSRKNVEITISVRRDSRKLVNELAEEAESAAQ